MTDLTGSDSNSVFKTNAQPVPPYYYITAHLDISGMEMGQTFYFNKDNNLSYLDPKKDDDGGYYKYWMIDSNAVIGDVVVFSNPHLLEGTMAVDDAYIWIGGADSMDGHPTGPVLQPWAGKTGFESGPLSINDINSANICYFGHEGGHDITNDDDSEISDKKVLAISLMTSLETPVPVASGGPSSSKKVGKPVALDRNKLPAKHSRSALRKLRQVKQVHDVEIDSGTVYVVVKVYPKFQ